MFDWFGFFFLLNRILLIFLNVFLGLVLLNVFLGLVLLNVFLGLVLLNRSGLLFI
jgi:hypothetical protein